MNTTMDFTKGSVPRTILRFYFPMLASALLQQFYSFADTAIVGRGLGDHALAAVGSMSSLSFLVIGFSMGLANGFAVLIAQHFGKRDYPQLRRTFYAMIRLACILTVLLTAISIIFLRPMLVLLQTDRTIMDDALLYGYILFGGLPTAVAYNISSGVLRSLGNSRTPLIAIVTASVLNILLDCLFIFVFHAGVGGAAAATVLSQLISAAICMKQMIRLDFLKKEPSDRKYDVSLYLNLLQNGIPMALMNSITAIGFMTVQYYVNGLGVDYNSAYSVCSKYLNMFMQPACTAGYTISAFAGQNYGARNYERIHQGLRVCLGIAGVSYALLGSAMTFFPQWLASLLLQGEEPITYAIQFLPVCGAMLFAVDMLFVYRSAVQGMGFQLVPMFSGILEMILRVGTVSLLIGRMGFSATAFAEISAWIGALLLNIAMFYYVFIKEQHKTQVHAFRLHSFRHAFSKIQ